MNKIIRSFLLFLIIAAMSEIANAQMFTSRGDHMNSNWNYGILGGVDFAQFSGSDIGKNDMRTFGNAGLFATYKVHKNFLLQPEVLYSVRGGKDKITAGTNKYRLSYIQVPVLAKGMANIAKNASVYAVAGPSASFKIGDGLNSTVAAWQDYKHLKDAGIGTHDFAFETNFGAGIQFGNLMLGGTYNLGLTDVFKNSDVKNSSFSVHLGIAVRDWHHPMKTR